MPENTSTMSAVREGMPVIDATGFAAFARAINDAEPEAVHQRAEYLIRLGFFKVDGDGLLERDIYAASEQIDYVGQDHIRLVHGAIAT